MSILIAAMSMSIRAMSIPISATFMLIAATSVPSAATVHAYYHTLRPPSQSILLRLCHPYLLSKLLFILGTRLHSPKGRDNGDLRVNNVLPFY